MSLVDARLNASTPTALFPVRLAAMPVPPRNAALAAGDKGAGGVFLLLLPLLFVIAFSVTAVYTARTVCTEKQSRLYVRVRARVHVHDV